MHTLTSITVWAIFIVGCFEILAWVIDCVIDWLIPNRQKATIVISSHTSNLHYVRVHCKDLIEKETVEGGWHDAMLAAERMLWLLRVKK